jgi:hypothetical protein
VGLKFLKPRGMVIQGDFGWQKDGKKMAKRWQKDANIAFVIQIHLANAI